MHVTSLVLVLLTSVPAASDVVAPGECYADCDDGLMAHNDRGPTAGQSAPSFTALRFDPETEKTEPRTLETLLRDRPVILAFGSYT